MKLFLLAVLCGLFVVPSALAYDEPLLTPAATHVVGRSITVHCEVEAEMFGAWGYTMPLSAPNELWLEDDLCQALVNPSQFEDWHVAMAVLTITHEGWHLRPWVHWSDEARVECAAIRRWRDTASFLGFTAEYQQSFGRGPWSLTSTRATSSRRTAIRSARSRVGRLGLLVERDAHVVLLACYQAPPQTLSAFHLERPVPVGG